MNIGKKIKEIRTALHMTAADLAVKLNIPVRTIGCYERNEAQPGAKFFIALIEQLSININWLLAGKGNMFIAQKNEFSVNYAVKIQEKMNLTPEELAGLLDILDSEASRDMLIKLILVKRGNKEALDSLIYNLQGIKAIYT